MFYINNYYLNTVNVVLSLAVWVYMYYHIFIKELPSF